MFIVVIATFQRHVAGLAWAVDGGWARSELPMPHVHGAGCRVQVQGTCQGGRTAWPTARASTARRPGRSTAPGRLEREHARRKRVHSAHARFRCYTQARERARTRVEHGDRHVRGGTTGARQEDSEAHVAHLARTCAMPCSTSWAKASRHVGFRPEPLLVAQKESVHCCCVRVCQHHALPLASAESSSSHLPAHPEGTSPLRAPKTLRAEPSRNSPARRLEGLSFGLDHKRPRERLCRISRDRRQ